MSPVSEVPTLEGLSNRVELLERQEVIYKMTIAALEKADSATAASVDKLARAINDPDAGLIVQLKLFRLEVAADRQAFKSWVRGATTILAVVVGFVSVVAPWIRVAIEGALHVSGLGP